MMILFHARYLPATDYEGNRVVVEKLGTDAHMFASGIAQRVQKAYGHMPDKIIEARDYVMNAQPQSASIVSRMLLEHLGRDNNISVEISVLQNANSPDEWYIVARVVLN